MSLNTKQTPNKRKSLAGQENTPAKISKTPKKNSETPKIVKTPKNKVSPNKPNSANKGKKGNTPKQNKNQKNTNTEEDIDETEISSPVKVNGTPKSPKTKSKPTKKAPQVEEESDNESEEERENDSDEEVDTDEDVQGETEVKERKPRHIVHVENIPYGTTYPELTEHFKNVGEILNVSMPVFNNLSVGYARIEVADEQSYKNALKLNGSSFKKAKLLVCPSENKFVLWIKKIRYNVTLEDLKAHFKDAGEIIKIHYPTYPGTDLYRGTALIEVADLETSKKAKRLSTVPLKKGFLDIFPLAVRQKKEVPDTFKDGFKRGMKFALNNQRGFKRTFKGPHNNAKKSRTQ